MFPFVLSFQDFCSPRSSSLPGTLPKYLREQASSMVRCFGCLFRWAAADDMIVWSAVLSTDHPAGSRSNNDQQGKQETGNRMKKAGHPVHLDQRVKHDITKASLFNIEYLIGGQNVCRFAWLTTTHTYIYFCLYFSLCVYLIFHAHLSSHFAFPAPHIDTVLQTAPSSTTSNPTLFSARRKEKEKNNKHLYLNTHISDSRTKLRQKKRKGKELSTNIRNAQTQDLKLEHEQAFAHTSQMHDWQTNAQGNSKHWTPHSQKSILCRNIL